MSFLLRAIRELGRAVFYIALLMAYGGLAGLVLYPLGALVFGVGEDGWRGVLLLGLKHGQQWAGVWAGGLAFILCFVDWRSRWWARPHN